MDSPIAHSLDVAGRLARRGRGALGALARALAEQDLLDDTDTAALAALHERLASDKLVLAFVAEFSRGKSELINAIFFADAGRRVLPATPGRTTMCPVELRFDAAVPPPRWRCCRSRRGCAACRWPNCARARCTGSACRWMPATRRRAGRTRLPP